MQRGMHLGKHVGVGDWALGALRFFVKLPARMSDALPGQGRMEKGKGWETYEKEIGKLTASVY